MSHLLLDNPTVTPSDIPVLDIDVADFVPVEWEQQFASDLVPAMPVQTRKTYPRRRDVQKALRVIEGRGKHRKTKTPSLGRLKALWDLYGVRVVQA